jgi:hypothetical protein
MGYTQSPEVFALYSDDCYLGVNNQVNETLEITVELNTTSQAANFIKHVFRSWHMAEALL